MRGYRRPIVGLGRRIKVLPQFCGRKKNHALKRRFQLLQDFVVVGREHHSQDVAVKGGRQEHVLFNAAPRFEKVKLAPGKFSLRQAAQLFHSAEQFLVKCIAQERLGVLIVSRRYWDSGYRYLGIDRRRAAQLQQLQAAIARGRLRDGLQMSIRRKVKS